MQLLLLCWSTLRVASTKIAVKSLQLIFSNNLTFSDWVLLCFQEIELVLDEQLFNNLISDQKKTKTLIFMSKTEELLKEIPVKLTIQ
jgi:hypothetical protein